MAAGAMKKQFIFLRFGMNNFTFDWFEWRLRWFECVALVSLENNANESMYVVIFINRNIPVKAKRELNRILESSKIRPYAYVIELDFPNEVKPKSLDFVNAHSSDDERVMVTRLDMDDGYAAGFLAEIDAMDDGEDQDKTVLYSFAPGYRFAIEEKRAIEWDIHYRGLNMFLFTKDRKATIWEFSHYLGHEYAEEKGWKIVEDYSLDHRWYRSETPDNTDVTVWENKYKQLVESIDREEAPVIELEEIISRFSLDADKLAAFYRDYPKIPYTYSILIYDSYLTKKCSTMRRDFNRLVDVYCESIPRNINEKPKTKWNIRRVQKEENCNFLHAIESLYSLKKLPESRRVERCETLSDLRRSFNKREAIIALSARGRIGIQLLDDVLFELGLTSDCEQNESSFLERIRSVLRREAAEDRQVARETAVISHSDGAAIALWDGADLHLAKSEGRLYKEWVIDLDGDKLTRLRATSCALPGAETAQLFIGDSNKHTWTSEIDYAMNEPGVNVAISLKKYPGRVVDAFVVAADRKLRRIL